MRPNLNEANGGSGQVPKLLDSTPIAILVVAVLYAVVANVAFLTATLQGGIAPIFPSSGIALAAVLILGRRVLSGVYLGSFVGNMVFLLSGSLTLQKTISLMWVNFVVAAGATMAAGAGAFLMRRFGGGQCLENRVRSLVVLILGGALGGCLISSTTGNLSLSVAGIVPWKLFGANWLTWWVGDAAGVIFVTPLILSWFHQYPNKINFRRSWEAVVLGAILVGLCFLVFDHDLRMEYAVLPLLLWAAFRFNMLGASAAASIIVLLATICTAHGRGPFIHGSVNESLLGLLSFLSVTVVCAFFLAAILAERKRAEEALAEQMILHTSIVNSTSDLIWSVEATRFTMLSFNRALQLHCQARNIPLATGMTLEGHLLQDEPVGQWRRFYQQAISEGGCSTEYSSGKESPVYQIQFNLLKQAERLFGISVFAKNVTSQRLLEAQLRQAQKMEAVGQLAGGVAHDFNNMLAAMMMNLDLLRDHPGLTPEVHEGLTELENEAKRAAGLTRQLLMFSRRSILEKRALNLNEVIANLKNMLSRLLGENIQLAFEPDPLLPPVEADSGMLEQVLMNLVVNARDAMPVGGRIRIATQTAEFNAEQAAANPDRTAGRFACLLVSDTGCGMDAATLKRIFEPFFTTKASGKGTGLGLATVYGIVVQHKGWVEVESRVGAGTAFRVFLPAMAGTPAKTGSLVSPPAPTGKETILVVEDALNLRRVLVQSLRGLGYRVLEAANGQEAMNLWHTHGLEIDLLFTDMVMPEGMTGLELAERVRAEKAGLKIIISSGYSAEITNLEKIVAAGITYLPKPYPVPQLGTVVRECLDGK